MTSTEDTTHECPGPECKARVQRDKLACVRHWSQVSKSTQRRVYRAYRSGTLTEHVDAMTAAIGEMRR